MLNKVATNNSWKYLDINMNIIDICLTVEMLSYISDGNYIYLKVLSFAL